MRTKKELLPGEWAVLALLCERPAHGYAIAATMAPDGDVGEIWSLSEQLTYRALRTLQTLGHAEVTAVTAGDRAPRRTELTATPSAKRLVTRWLGTPERHIRELRPALLLKLHLLRRRGRSPVRLLEAQGEMLRALVAEIDATAVEQQPTAMLHHWRRHMAAGALEFVEQELGAERNASRSRSRGR